VRVANKGRVRAAVDHSGHQYARNDELNQDGTMNKRIAFISALSMALPCVICAPAVQAAAFYISEIGSTGSLGTAGVANTTNNFGADSSWTNPAGMTGLERDMVVGGFQLVIPKIEFDSDIAGAGGSGGGKESRLAKGN